MRTILAHVETSSGAESLASCALTIADALGGSVDAAHFGAAQAGLIAAGADGFVAGAPELLRAVEENARERASIAEKAWRQAAGEERPAWRWRSDYAEGGAQLGAVGRLYDLIAVGRPAEGANAPSLATIEGALFETGRLVLAAPPELQKPFDPLGHLVILWNGGAETARALSMAGPLLERARERTVLSAADGMTPGPGGDALAEILNAAGLPTATRSIEGGEGSVGERLCAECAALGADLAIKGAYTQSRLRQLIFGGATSHLLQEAALPVLWAA